MTSILWFKQQQIFKFKSAKMCRKMMELKFLVKFTSTQCVLKKVNYKDLRKFMLQWKIISADKVLMALMVLVVLMAIFNMLSKFLVKCISIHYVLKTCNYKDLRTKCLLQWKRSSADKVLMALMV